MAPRYHLCRCGARYEKTKRKCPSCGKTRAKKRVPKHAQTLRDHSYEHYLEVSKEIHGVTDESCCVCRRPKGKIRHHREHGHLQGDPAFGKPRGIACYQCNTLMPRLLDVERAKQVYEYLLRVDTYYRKAESAVEDGDTKPEESCLASTPVKKADETESQ